MAIFEAEYTKTQVSDKRIDAGAAANYANDFLGSGVLTLNNNNLLVSISGSQIKVNKGVGYILGYRFSIIGSDDFLLPVSGSDGYYRVVVKIDKNPETKGISLYLKYGSASAGPTLQRTNTVYELSLASFRKVGAVLSTLVDERGNATYCGVSSVSLNAPLPIASGGTGVINENWYDAVWSLGANRYLPSMRYAGSSTLGTYIPTNLNANEDRTISLKLWGSGYATGVLDIAFNAYNYNSGNKMLFVNATTADPKVAPTISVFNHNGKICFYVTNIDRFQTLIAYCWTDYVIGQPLKWQDCMTNHITDIVHQAKPTNITRNVDVVPGGAYGGITIGEVANGWVPFRTIRGAAWADFAVGATPAASLEFRATGVSGGGITNRLDMTASGVKINYGQYTTGSTRKIKKYIYDIKPADYEKIYNLRPVTYRQRKRDGDEDPHTYMGLIAEEVDEVGLKQVVTYNEEGEADGILYSSLVAPLISVVQNHKKEIDALKSENAAMRKELDEIKEMIKEMAI